MKTAISVPLSLLAALPLASAWGAVGHEAVAYVATDFVSAATKSYCQRILGDTSANYLASVATWADTYRSTNAGKFSAPFHFIDANDAPPSSCSVDFDRDCGATGCVVGAINNYTGILTSQGDFNALKFLIHFIGDIHQPLHDEALDKGGNTIAVTFNSVTTNLHTVWDTTMLTKLTGGTTIAVARTFATTLSTKIKTGSYRSLASSWLTGTDLSDPISTGMVWAKQSNAIVCDEVLGVGLRTIEGEDLSGDYYTAAVPVLELQIARAGYRLAAWLNLIATGSVGL